MLSKFILQSGLRLDYTKNLGTILLPHISLLYKVTKNFQARVTAGSGYQNPNIFKIANGRNILHRNVYLSDKIVREKANSLNFDFGYKVVYGEFVFRINQAFYYNKINNYYIPYYIPNGDPNILYQGSGSLETKGFDTNLYLALDEIELFADYSFQDVNKSDSDEETPLLLTPKNKLNLTLTYENEGNWKAGIEAFYTGKQYLPVENENGFYVNSYTRTYWLLGAMFQKMFGKFSVIVNVENILDERQSKYEQIVTGEKNSPYFRPLFMPIDGIIGNIAFWIKI